MREYLVRAAAVPQPGREQGGEFVGRVERARGGGHVGALVVWRETQSEE